MAPRPTAAKPATSAAWSEPAASDGFAAAKALSLLMRKMGTVTLMGHQHAEDEVEPHAAHGEAASLEDHPDEDRQDKEKDIDGDGAARRVCERILPKRGEARLKIGEVVTPSADKGQNSNDAVCGTENAA